MPLSWVAGTPARDQRGLNVIVNRNSANNFIFFGKGVEMASNRADDLEISMLALQLLQLSLVYLNTLRIQQVLAESAWADRLTLKTSGALPR